MSKFYSIRENEDFAFGDGVVYIKNININYLSLVKMKDGSYELALNLFAHNGRCYANRTYKIRLDKNNNPYIYIGKENEHDYTLDNCVSTKYNYFDGLVKDSYKPFCYEEGRFDAYSGVFKFDGNCVKEDKRLNYFMKYLSSIGIKDKGLAILVKYLELSEAQKEVTKRLSPASSQELARQKEVVNNILKNFTYKDAEKLRLETKRLETMVKGAKELDPTKIIVIDLAKYEHLLDNYKQ